MPFKYINPGYIELLGANLSSSNGNVEDIRYNPTNKIAFFQTSYRGGRFLSKTKTGDIYLKFDMYITNLNSNNMSDFFVGYCAGSSWYKYGVSYYNYNLWLSMGSNRLNNSNYSIKFPGLNKVWVHLHITNDYNTSYGEIMLNGSRKKISCSESYYLQGFSDSTNTIYVICGERSDIYFSNIIISDEYIDPKEEVIILPTIGVETTMTYNQDGTYTADEAGQTLLQTVNAVDLITQYGKNSKVTSIASAGVPAYKTAAGLSNLVGIDKIGGQLTEHNAIAVSSSIDSGVLDCWNIDMTIGELDSKKIGWKAAT